MTNTQSRKPVQQAGEKFERDAIPSNAPEIQRQEMQTAFYFGFTESLRALKKLGDNGLSEDEAARRLESLWRECLQFVESKNKPMGFGRRTASKR
jgi:hypothetical protein